MTGLLIGSVTRCKPRFHGRVAPAVDLFWPIEKKGQGSRFPRKSSANEQYFAPTSAAVAARLAHSTIEIPQTKVMASKNPASIYLFTIEKNGPKFPSSQF